MLLSEYLVKISKRRSINWNSEITSARKKFLFILICDELITVWLQLNDIFVCNRLLFSRFFSVLLVLRFSSFQKYRTLLMFLGNRPNACARNLAPSMWHQKTPCAVEVLRKTRSCCWRAKTCHATNCMSNSSAQSRNNDVVWFAIFGDNMSANVLSIRNLFH